MPGGVPHPWLIEFIKYDRYKYRVYTGFSTILTIDINKYIHNTRVYGDSNYIVHGD